MARQPKTTTEASEVIEGEVVEASSYQSANGGNNTPVPNGFASNDQALVVSTSEPRNDRLKLYTSVLETAQVEFLLQKTPAKEIKTRQGRGGMTFKYVEQSYVVERLNMIFGFNWDFKVKNRSVEGNEVIVEGELTARTANGQVITKQQFGSSQIKKNQSGTPVSLGDDYKSAASDAMKKCASLLGIGIDLYGRDGDPLADDPEESNSDEVKKRIAAAAYAAGYNSEQLRDLVLSLNPSSGKTFAELTNAERLAIEAAAIRRLASERAAQPVG